MPRVSTDLSHSVPGGEEVEDAPHHPGGLSLGRMDSGSEHHRTTTLQFQQRRSYRSVGVGPGHKAYVRQGRRQGFLSGGYE